MTASETSFGPHAFLIYLSVLLVISAITIFTIPETKGRELSDDVESFTDAGRGQRGIKVAAEPLVRSE